MKKMFSLISAAVVLLSGAALMSPAAHADGSNVITDIELRRCIAAAMDGMALPLSASDAPGVQAPSMPDWIASDAVSISQTDLENFAAGADGVQLWCPDMGITTLEGLQYLATAPDADHVLGANFSGDQISDASVLGGLHWLTMLDLTDNKVSNAGFLDSLPDLEQLLLDGNQISDISGLGVSKPQGLWQLQLSDNKVNNISAVADLVGLQEVDLSSNQIVDPSPLAGLTALTNLDLSNNQIEDVGSLADANMPNLAILNLNNNQVDDVSAFAQANMPVLTEIDLRDNQVADVMGLGQGVFTDLEVLDLGQNSISDDSNLSAFDPLSSLIRLDLDNNSISDVTPLATLVADDPDLRWLTLYGNEISDISPLLPYLQWMGAAWPATSGNSWKTDYPDYCANQACLTVDLDGNRITNASGLPENTGYSDATDLGVSLGVQNIDGVSAKVGETINLPDVKPTPGHGPVTWQVEDGDAVLNGDGTVTFNTTGTVLLGWQDSSVRAGTVNDDGQELSPGFSGTVIVDVGSGGGNGNGNSQTGGGVVPNHDRTAALLLMLASGLIVISWYRKHRRIGLL